MLITNHKSKQENEDNDDTSESSKSEPLGIEALDFTNINKRRKQIKHQKEVIIKKPKSKPTKPIKSNIKLPSKSNTNTSSNDKTTTPQSSKDSFFNNDNNDNVSIKSKASAEWKTDDIFPTEKEIERYKWEQKSFNAKYEYYKNNIKTKFNNNMNIIWNDCIIVCLGNTWIFIKYIMRYSWNTIKLYAKSGIKRIKNHDWKNVSIPVVIILLISIVTMIISASINKYVKCRGEVLLIIYMYIYVKLFKL